MKKLETKNFKKKLFAVVPLLLSAGVSAYGGSVTFSYDSQNGVAGLGSGASNANIQTYMNAVLAASGCTGCSVTVTGAVADQTYNGEGHVTGPSSAKSLTLGTSNGATASNTASTVNATYDTFIANTNDSSGSISTMITMKFSGFTGLAVNSFDYEIFPDGTCAQLNSANCGGVGNPNQPDLIFQAGNSAAPNGTDPVQKTFLGVTPGTTNGNATHSPNSGGTSAELAPQAIGTWTTGITGVTSLDFVDWPATIGIDNLNVSWSTPPVPEPVSIFLLGTVAAGLFLRKKLQKT
jgi:hypothetical protein